jgi:gamma-butyrobetaine dioxygenase
MPRIIRSLQSFTIPKTIFRPQATTTSTIYSLQRPLFSRSLTVHALPGHKRLNLQDDAFTTSYDFIFLRDSCSCASCIDPSTSQKVFNTADISNKITCKSVNVLPDKSVEIEWENDMNGYSPNHKSVFSYKFLKQYSNLKRVNAARYNDQQQVLWDRNIMERHASWFDYESYMADDKTLLDALKQLQLYGLIFLKKIPDEEHTIEKISSRIGEIRNTFYGRTWDVKSVPNAKNVA